MRVQQYKKKINTFIPDALRLILCDAVMVFWTLQRC